MIPVSLQRSLENIEQQSLILQQLTSRTQSHEIVDSIAQSATQYFILKWALFQLIIIIGVGVGQVYLVRHWFDIVDHDKIRENQNLF